MDFREEALEILKNNNVSIANMAVWIAGYIAGREESDRLALLKYEAREFTPEGEYTSDSYGYTQFKDLQENL